MSSDSGKNDKVKGIHERGGTKASELEKPSKPNDNSSKALLKSSKRTRSNSQNSTGSDGQHYEYDERIDMLPEEQLETIRSSWKTTDWLRYIGFCTCMVLCMLIFFFIILFAVLVLYKNLFKDK